MEGYKSYVVGRELLKSKPALKELLGAVDNALKNIPSATFSLKYGYLSWSSKPYYQQVEEEERGEKNAK